MAVAYPIGDRRNARGAQLARPLAFRASRSRSQSRRRLPPAGFIVGGPHRCFASLLRTARMVAQTTVRDPTSSSMGAGTPIRGVATGRLGHVRKLDPIKREPSPRCERHSPPPRPPSSPSDCSPALPAPPALRRCTATVRTRSRLPPRARPPARRSSRLGMICQEGQEDGRQEQEVLQGQSG